MCLHTFTSPDAVTWTQVGGAPTGASGTAKAAFKGSIFVLGGFVESDPMLGGDAGCTSTVTYSTDGTMTWHQYEAPWPGRADFQAAVFNDRLWILGGGCYPYYGGQTNDAWYTEDGLNWNEAPRPTWSDRSEFSVAVGAGKMWVSGGLAPGGHTALNDTWYTEDGTTWTQATAAAPWYPRHGHSSVVYDNKLWIAGGQTADYVTLDDLWYTSLVEPKVAADATQGGWYQTGGAIDLSVTATGLAGQLTYQWFKDGAALDGATNATYHVDQAAPSDAGTYTCQVTDQAQSKTTYTTPPIPIYVFPTGSLPAATTLTLTLTALTLLTAYRKRRKY